MSHYTEVVPFLSLKQEGLWLRCLKQPSPFCQEIFAHLSLRPIEIMGDPELMMALKRGVEDIESGMASDWEDVKTELQIEL